MKILITIDGHIEVSPELLSDLSKCQAYSSDYRNGNVFKKSDRSPVSSIEIPDNNDFIDDENQATIDINNILEENNRLSRLVESLQSKLEVKDKSASTDLSLID